MKTFTVQCHVVVKNGVVTQIGKTTLLDKTGNTNNKDTQKKKTA